MIGTGVINTTYIKHTNDYTELTQKCEFRIEGNNAFLSFPFCVIFCHFLSILILDL